SFVCACSLGDSCRIDDTIRYAQVPSKVSDVIAEVLEKLLRLVCPDWREARSGHGQNRYSTISQCPDNLCADKSRCTENDYSLSLSHRTRPLIVAAARHSCHPKRAQDVLMRLRTYAAWAA